MIVNNKRCCDNCGYMGKEAEIIHYWGKGYMSELCKECDDCIDPSLKREKIKKGELFFVQ